MATSLLDWIMHLLKNPEAREHFQADPQGAMASAGMSSVCGADVRDARAFLLDHSDVHPAHAVHSAHEATAHEAKAHEATGPHAHEHIKYIVDNYTFSPKHAHHGVRADGAPDVPHVHHSHPRPHHGVHHATLLSNHSDRHDHQVDDSHERHAVHSYGVGPTSDGSTGGDQSGSRVGHNQLELGGRGNLLGDGNDFSEHDPRFNHEDSHRHDTNVRGNGSAGHDVRVDSHRYDSDVSGNGSAGRDVHVDKNGPVMGQGVANGDIDHTKGLAGLDHTVSVGNVNLLSGLVNTGDVLDHSVNPELNHSLNHTLNHTPILSGDPILAGDPILSGDLNRSPILSSDLNNSLNRSLNHLGQGSLDDLLHNTDIHDIHDIHVLA